MSNNEEKLWNVKGKQIVGVVGKTLVLCDGSGLKASIDGRFVVLGKEDVDYVISQKRQELEDMQRSLQDL